MLKVKRIGEIAFYAVDSRSLVDVLKKLGIYRDVAAGRTRCYICGRPVAVESLGGLFKYEGQVRLVCNDIRCLYEAARMIAAEVLRVGLTPASRRQAAAALGLALVAALRRAGSFGHIETHAWRGVPDLAHISGEEVEVELSHHVDADAVEDVAEELRQWDGVTVALNGRLGTVELGVEIDIYAGEHIPVLAGIMKEDVDVLAEPRGHVGGKVVESFYELFDVERGKMKEVVEELVAEMRRVELKVATYAGAKMQLLWRLVTGVYALRDYSFTPEDAVLLWCRQWIRQMAKYLYRMSPPGLRELVGHYGMRRVAGGVAPELLNDSAKHYDVRLHGDAMQLFPLSAESHRNAVAELRYVLAEAMREASDRKAWG